MGEGLAPLLARAAVPWYYGGMPTTASPRKQDTQATARNVRLSYAQGERLRTEAFKERRPQSEIMRDALDLYFAQKDARKAERRAAAAATA